MSDIYMDGFDHYSSSNAGLLIQSPFWTDVNTYSTSGSPSTFIGVPSWGPANTGPYCLVSGFGAPSNLKTHAVQCKLAATTSTVYVSLYFAMDALPPNNYSTWILGFNQTGLSSNPAMAIGVTTDGRLIIALQGQNDNSIFTSAPVLTAQQFHLIEVCWDGTSNQTITIRVDDPLLNKPAPALVATTSAIPIQYVQVMPQYKVTTTSPPAVYNAAAPGGTYVDDFYIRDTSGTINTGWQGDRRILWCPVTVDTTSDSWTTPATASFSTPVMPSNSVIVSAIQFNQPLWTASGTATEVGKLIGPLGASASGSSHTVTTVKTIFSDIYNIDPDTSRQVDTATIVNNQLSINLS